MDNYDSLSKDELIEKLRRVSEERDRYFLQRELARMEWQTLQFQSGDRDAAFNNLKEEDNMPLSELQAKFVARGNEFDAMKAPYFNMRQAIAIRQKGMENIVKGNPELSAEWSQEKREEPFDNLSHYRPLLSRFTEAKLDNAKTVLTNFYKAIAAKGSMKCKKAYPRLFRALEDAGEEQAVRIVNEYLDKIGYNPYH